MTLTHQLPAGILIVYRNREQGGDFFLANLSRIAPMFVAKSIQNSSKNPRATRHAPRATRHAPRATFS